MNGQLASNFDRREWFRSMGIAVGGATCLGESVFAQENAAANVADRTSSIRITALHPNICRDRVYVRIDTNHGISGWGEIKGVVPSVAAALARSMFQLLDGQNPTRIEHLWQMLYRAERNQRGGAFMVHCIAGIDMALWDITGKLWGVPVYRLLGGPVRDRIRVYPSAKAIKVGNSPKPQSGDPDDIEQMVANVRAAREKVGTDGTVMCDAHSAVPPATLVQFAAAIEPYEVLFLEEPAVTGNIETFKRLKQQIRIPLAAGERDRTIWGILPYLSERVLDIVQPDCGYTGGISQMKKIATLAEAYYVPLAPHCTQSYLGMTASFHVTASIPLFLIHESYDHEPFRRFIHPHWEKGDDGYVSLPEGVGLGVDIDEAMLAQVAADPNYQYRWRGPRYYDDGSVADY
ncbi:MAG TPA: mandelate racemase/muconate lactonizing enzyme family protein [Pirellulaceae bacterium]|nr:mandelate racemase/muconate lactonizing enzyme family protein [Pirellulaceae bacterium]